MQLQGRARESLTPQQLREWYASWGCRGGRSGSRSGVGRSGASGSGQVQLPCPLSPQQLRAWFASWGCRGGRSGSRSGVGRSGASGSGQVQLPCPLSPQQLREWYASWGCRGGRSGSRSGVRRSGASGSGQVQLPCPVSEAAALGASASVALGAGEATTPGTRVSATPGAGEAAALGASESAPPGTESTEALHTFTLDSGASRCFFRDRTALEPLARPVAVSLADPSGGPVIATSSTVLPCPAVPSGTLSARDTLHVCSDGPSPGYLHSAAGVRPVHTDH
ncbi:unnamed protein product [Closterium sp. Naga37s-1]|nr:unnamed protein product [Closterium sp. Naga37s-1]